VSNLFRKGGRGKKGKKSHAGRVKKGETLGGNQVAHEHGQSLSQPGTDPNAPAKRKGSRKCSKNRNRAPVPFPDQESERAGPWLIRRRNVDRAGNHLNTQKGLERRFRRQESTCNGGLAPSTAESTAWHCEAHTDHDRGLEQQDFGPVQEGPIFP